MLYVYLLGVHLSPQPGPSSEATEATLWTRWATTRDDDAAGLLWQRYQRVSVAVAVRVLRGVTDAHSEAPGIADEAFMRALHSYDPTRAPAGADKPFRSWYLRITRTAALDERRKRTRDDLDDHPEQPSVNPGPALEASIDAHRLVARLRAWNQEHGLAEDWPVLEAWLEARHDGIRVPWKALARAHPVLPPDDIDFAPGSSLLAANDPYMHHAVRKLDLCPTLEVGVQGGHTAPEPDGLATARAQVVVDSLQHSVRVRRARRPTGPVDRIRPRGEPPTTGPRATFTVEAGGTRSPDALRMRVEKVILGKLKDILLLGEDR